VHVCVASADLVPAFTPAQVGHELGVLVENGDVGEGGFVEIFHRCERELLGIPAKEMENPSRTYEANILEGFIDSPGWGNLVYGISAHQRVSVGG
jgi:hypothetical protein